MPCVSMLVKKTRLSPGEAGQGHAPLQDGGVSDPLLAEHAHCWCDASTPS